MGETNKFQHSEFNSRYDPAYKEQTGQREHSPMRTPPKRKTQKSRHPKNRTRRGMLGNDYHNWAAIAQRPTAAESVSPPRLDGETRSQCRVDHRPRPEQLREIVVDRLMVTRASHLANRSWCGCLRPAPHRRSTSTGARSLPEAMPPASHYPIPPARRPIRSPRSPQL